jgi:hypothetical protein
MPLTYFQQYEQRRKRYEPGVIWKEKQPYHTVRILRIVTPSEIDGESSVYRLYQGQRNVCFRILKSEDFPGNSLSEGAIASWSEDYMERNYEVAIDD